MLMSDARLQEAMDRTVARGNEIMDEMEDQQWVDRCGRNMSGRDVIVALEDATGRAQSPLTVRVGGIYQNGGIWFQRIS